MSIPETSDWDKSSQPKGGIREAIQGHILSISQTPVFLAIILLTATLCLGIGLLAHTQNAQPKEPLWIEQLPAAALPGSMSSSTWTVNGGLPEDVPITKTAKSPSKTSPQPAAAAAASLAPNPNGAYVASKTGTKYYLPSCGTAKRIKDSNKVWFATKSEAEAAGYTPAANCKGL